MRENCADLGMNVPLGMGKFTQAISLGMGTRPVPKWVPMSRSSFCAYLYIYFFINSREAFSYSCLSFLTTYRRLAISYT